MDTVTLKQIAEYLRKQGMKCNCDLDNWHVQDDTGHTWACSIHKAAKAANPEMIENLRNQNETNIDI